MEGNIFEQLSPIFDPESVAVIGASNSPYKWGNWMVSRPINSGYRGAIYPVNPKERSILGLKAYPDLRSILHPVDLAVITIPAPGVPDAMRACAQKGVRGALIISAGFAETGESGRMLQEEVLRNLLRLPERDDGWISAGGGRS